MSAGFPWCGGITGGGVFLNAKDYGATGNGTNDDTAAIQAAIDAAYGLASATPNLNTPAGANLFSGGGTVYLPTPPNVYLIGSKGVGLLMRNRITLRGDGWGTILKLANGADCSMITNDASLAIDQLMWSVQQLRLWGNAAGQTGTSHGIYVDVTAAYGATTAEEYDVDCFFEDVFAWDCLTDGFSVNPSSRGNIRFLACKARDNGGNGFTLGQDCYVTDCDSGLNTGNGFSFGGGSGMASNCKAWQNGFEVYTSNNVGNGFYLNGSDTAQLVGCYAQDNGVFGYFLNGATNCVLSGIMADSNGSGGSGAAGISCYQATNCRISGASIDQNRNPNRQPYGLQMSGPSTGCNVDLVCTGNTTGDLQSSCDGNRVNIGAANGGHQTITFSASITPNPHAGSVVSVTLTGALTLNAPTIQCATGEKLTFVLTQDGTGGRVTTWTGYKQTGALTTTASAINVAEFVYDGANWNQVALSAGV